MWGFTRAEQRAILFLLVMFACGSAVLWYRRNLPPPPVDPALLDSLRVHAQHFEADTVLSAERDTTKLQREKRIGPIDLNTATLEDLIGLPGVGEVLAKRILEYRAGHGKFTRVEELEKVKGLGKSKVQALKGHVLIR